MEPGRTEKRGYVYILVNPSFTGFVKIGKTIHEPEVRARQLSAVSGVPAPYAVAWDVLVNDCDHVERLIHQHLAETRSRRDREFFATPLKNAIAVASTIAAPFLCEPENLASNVPLQPLAVPEQPEVASRPKRVRREGPEELIAVAEDCPVNRAEAPPKGNPKTIARLGYEILIEHPYKYTEREFFYELHAVRRKRPDLNYESYNIKRAQIVKVHGWGIHRDQDGKLALVAMESPRYKELQATIKTSKAYRTNKAPSGLELE
ncbi:hypothetical protein GEOBRER4_n1904 [Citrifermentans bremense]|uniref:Bacteriophage T5 Orf172 DNA-binding domain-containing protein n=1 Tax=Citrifermentans bremense TaxID=60035 RepID=A0A6S6LYG8_9BACT|nr:DUF6157 family protein [Citrifermentans bremense]BCG47082.1 hypothetical protein GEOBRER4_n1904 [Citrifermentans bremense]